MYTDWDWLNGIRTGRVGKRILKKKFHPSRVTNAGKMFNRTCACLRSKVPGRHYPGGVWAAAQGPHSAHQHGAPERCATAKPQLPTFTSPQTSPLVTPPHPIESKMRLVAIGPHSYGVAVQVVGEGACFPGLRWLGDAGALVNGVGGTRKHNTRP